MITIIAVLLNKFVVKDDEIYYWCFATAIIDGLMAWMMFGYTIELLLKNA